MKATFVKGHNGLIIIEILSEKIKLLKEIVMQMTLRNSSISEKKYIILEFDLLN